MLPKAPSMEQEDSKINEISFDNKVAEEMERVNHVEQSRNSFMMPSSLHNKTPTSNQKLELIKSHSRVPNSENSKNPCPNKDSKANSHGGNKLELLEHDSIPISE